MASRLKLSTLAGLRSAPPPDRMGRCDSNGTEGSIGRKPGRSTSSVERENGLQRPQYPDILLWIFKYPRISLEPVVPLYIKDDTTARLVTRLAKLRGLSKQDARWFKKCCVQVTPKIAGAAPAKGFRVSSVTLI